ncbi:MAG: LPS assembly lipoprotein LptE [Methylococcaceae bacterium]|nr:LPS assembly lipoprotein LptE [Methylococcaceae bacterium]
MNRNSQRPVNFFIVLAACLSFSGCGFHLRGSEGDTSFVKSMYIEGIPDGDAFATAFRQAMSLGGTQVAAKVGDSAGIVHIHKAIFQRRGVVLSRTGRATGYDLTYRVVYDVRSPSGEVLQPTKEMEVKRDYFNDQSLPLAQLTEEALIRQEIEKELAQMLFRRASYVLKQAPDKAAKPAQTPEKKS